MLISASGPGEEIIWSNGVAGDLCAMMSERASREQDISSLCYQSMKATAITVPALSLDLFVAAEQIDRIDILKVSVQGAETLVLEGMPQMLQEGRVSVFIFEYMNRWLEYNRDFALNLQTVVQELDGFGFDSYLATRAELIPITGSCWSEAYLPVNEMRIVVALHRNQINGSSVRETYMADGRSIKVRVDEQLYTSPMGSEFKGDHSDTGNLSDPKMYYNLSCAFEWSKYSCAHQGDCSYCCHLFDLLQPMPFF